MSGVGRDIVTSILVDKVYLKCLKLLESEARSWQAFKFVYGAQASPSRDVKTFIKVCTRLIPEHISLGPFVGLSTVSHPRIQKPLSGSCPPLPLSCYLFGSWKTTRRSDSKQQMSLNSSHRAKRACMACLACRKKKIRCDITARGIAPCTRCGITGEECLLAESRRGR
jgi:hypothetical protein